MKLTQKLKADILKLYHSYWDTYMGGDIKHLASFLDDTVVIYGTAPGEVFSSKKAAIKFYSATADQMTGNAELRNRKISLKSIADTVLVNEVCDLYVLIEGEWVFYSHARLTSVWKQKGKTWKLAHQHGSFPDSRADEGDQIGSDKIKEENRQLKEAVERRTVELEHKNKELGIASSLERIRTVAMAMQRPADMLNICRAICTELTQLGLQETRNIQTAIFYPARGTYMNYEYYKKHDKAIITEVNYAGAHVHKDQQKFAALMLKGDGAFYTKSFKGEKLKKWYQYQKGTEQLADRFLLKAHSLNYYMFSLGTITLGISTYYPLTADELELFKRFRNVFGLAYRRYLDIEKAEAQAREAEIELALERLRAKSMAMRRSDELADLVYITFQELTRIGFSLDRCIIMTFDDQTNDSVWWLAGSNGISNPVGLAVPNHSHKPYKAYLRAWKKSLSQWSYLLKGDEKKQWDAYMFNETELRKLPGMVKKGMQSVKEIYLNACFSRFAGITFSAMQPVSESEFDILHRFARVFEQSYTRFLDLLKAEEQAREAQIEVAVERVRAKALAMHNSVQILEVVYSLKNEMLGLKIQGVSAATIYLQEQDGDIRMWDLTSIKKAATGLQVTLDVKFKLEESDPQFYLRKIWNGKENYFVVKQDAKSIARSFKWLRRYNPGEADAAEKFLKKNPIKYLFHPTVQLSNGKMSVDIMNTDPPAEMELIMLKMGAAFDLAYKRFLDLQKSEQRTKESRIELALERIRARSMSMHKSEELKEVIQLVYDQFTELQIDVEHTGFIIDYKAREDMHIWLADKHSLAFEITIPYFDAPHWNSFREAKKKGVDFFVNNHTFREKNRFYKMLFKHIPDIPRKVKENVLKCPGLTISTVLLDNVGLYIENFSGIPFTEEANDILMRFGNVFQQTYTRFLDLQKAEAQAREAQINLAVERVRARALAMFKSEEILQVVHKLKEEIMGLNIPNVIAATIYLKEEDGLCRIWDITSLDLEKATISTPMDIRFRLEDTHPGFFMRRIWNNDADYFIEMQDENDLAITLQWVRDHGRHEQAAETEQFTRETQLKKLYHPTTRLNNGRMCIDLLDAPEPETASILAKMGAAFDLAYKRFEDLKNSETQLRESQVELSLERIRAKVTAMQVSSDLLDIVVTMRTEFVTLGHDAHYFWHMRWLPDSYEKAMTSGDGSRIGNVMTLPRHIHSEIPLISGWEKGNEPTVVYAMDTEAAVDYVIKMITLGNFEQVDPNAPTLDDMRAIGGLTFIMARTTHGEIGYSLPGSVPHPPAESIATLVRFAAVFDLAYRRFEDLKSSEKQNRETQIELALERVRARTMAMQHSDELADASFVLDTQVRSLGIQTWGCAFNIYGEKESTEWFSSAAGMLPPYKTPREDFFLRAYDAGQSGQALYIEEFVGEDCKAHYEYLSTIPIMGDAVKSMIKNGGSFPERQVDHATFFKYGYLLFITMNPAPETHDIFIRFAKVFEQTYTRFLDLQKAEAQAKEARIEAALEKVRSRTLAMQQSDELAETASELFRQMIGLGIEPNRLYITIINEARNEADFWITDEDNSKPAVAYTVDLTGNATFGKMYQGWKQQLPRLIIDLHGEELQNYFRYLQKIHVPFKGGLTQQRRVQHLAYFSKGFIGLASPDEQPAETISILDRFAYAFNLTFTRFSDLQIAEAHTLQAEQDLLAIKEAKQKAEEALMELQATQKQLIQAEKMASLGELTAGIAHEIQNPLNFVNNFSEVSSELIDEMKEELVTGNAPLAIEIAEDIKQNLGKINHHGKRADAIVKGMLQHSRTSSGQKEMTDINALCDEYLRLAYHGIRARDKSFNATFETLFDNDLEKISVIPQDIGRVILNLVNNAFYAVNEKKKRADHDYQPSVTVSTRRENASIAISVTDNGSGIPANVLDKIFQPFFTTKPTGQGTGLGLSLAYDIIKAHDSELTATTKEGEGTTFLIVLPHQAKSNL